MASLPGLSVAKEWESIYALSLLACPIDGHLVAEVVVGALPGCGGQVLLLGRYFVVCWWLHK